MTRLFLQPEKLSTDRIIIDDDNARYLSLVLKIKPGEQIVIFDGAGYRYLCRILEVHKKEVVAEKMKKESYSAESPVSITLAQGLPKSDKMDLIIQKATELGVNKIVPLITERSQVRHTEKIGRWRKIALSASQQCGREKVPEIKEPVEFERYVKNFRYCLATENADSGITAKAYGSGQARNDTMETSHLKIIFSEEQKERNLKKVLAAFKNVKNITIIVGPEGGFSKEEVSAAVEKGFVEASLGPRILRTETAPIAAISIVQYELGDMG